MSGVSRVVLAIRLALSFIMTLAHTAVPCLVVHKQRAITYGLVESQSTCTFFSLLLIPQSKPMLHFFSLFSLAQNPELVARLERIKAQLAHQEYDRMVENVSTLVC